jgi:hypothetical protein
MKLASQKSRAAVALLAVAIGGSALMASAQDELRLPSNIDFRRAQSIERELTQKKSAQPRMKVYTQMLGIDDKTQSRLLMPVEVARAAGSNKQIEEWFRSSIAQTERFTVMDESTTGVQSESSINVEGIVLSASQTLEDYAGVRKASSHFRFALKIKDTDTGEVLKARTVVAEYGAHPGEGHPISAGKSLDDPVVKQWLEADFKKGLEELMNNVAAYVERTYRPIGKVIDSSKDEVLLYGGEKQGIKNGDAMVIFRIPSEPDGSLNFNKLKRVVGAVRCDSVGESQSQCRVVRKGDAWPVKLGDFGVLADDSLKLGDK